MNTRMIITLCDNGIVTDTESLQRPTRTKVFQNFVEACDYISDVIEDSFDFSECEAPISDDIDTGNQEPQ